MYKWTKLFLLFFLLLSFFAQNYLLDRGRCFGLFFVFVFLQRWQTLGFWLLNDAWSFVFLDDFCHSASHAQSWQTERENFHGIDGSDRGLNWTLKMWRLALWPNVPWFKPPRKLSCDVVPSGIRLVCCVIGLVRGQLAQIPVPFASPSSDEWIHVEANKLCVDRKIKWFCLLLLFLLILLFNPSKHTLPWYVYSQRWAILLHFLSLAGAYPFGC